MYQQMLDRGMTHADLVRAGYFEDNFSDRGRMVSNMSLRNKVLKGIAIGMSGCFAPVHEGHVHALELAQKYFLNNGYDDVEAFIFPAHDSYVKQKLGKMAKHFTIDKRLSLMDKILPSWISIDAFPAKHLPNEVNFPFIVDRLQCHGDMLDYDTAFVVGGDNAGFAPAFADSRTKFVVINRKNSFTLDRNLLTSVDYHEITENKHHELSSTHVRSQLSLPSQG
jgi:nicotinic acid mononucleotide adenylyltransferase